VWKSQVGHWRGRVSAVEPELNRFPFVAVPVGGDDWVAHHFVSDGTCEQVRVETRRLRRRRIRTPLSFVLIDDLLLTLHLSFEPLNGTTRALRRTSGLDRRRRRVAFWFHRQPRDERVVQLDSFVSGLNVTIEKRPVFARLTHGAEGSGNPSTRSARPRPAPSPPASLASRERYESGLPRRHDICVRRTHSALLACGFWVV
jgi:hypothetical protein